MTSRLLSVGVLALSVLALPLLLRLPRGLELDVGPGDRGYVQGLASAWRLEGDVTWREVGRRARLRLPATIEGGRLSLSVSLSLSEPERRPVGLQVSFDDGTRREITVPPSDGFRDVGVELPPARVRTDVRLRVDGPGRLRIAGARWEGTGARPQRTLLVRWALAVAFTFAALLFAGLGLGGAAGGLLVLVAAFALLARLDPFGFVHLVGTGAAVSALGLAVVAAGRLVLRNGSTPFLVLVHAAVWLKCGLLLHPSFFFYDLPIHETLLELVYHRGAADFWSNLPAYQVQHNLGLSRVGEAYHPYPYPVLFYYVAHLGNRVVHAPELWLKLTFGLFGALCLLPVGDLARRLTGKPRADFYAAFAYLFAPAFLLAHLILGMSSIAGHFFDLVLVAVLAKLALDVRGWPRAAGIGLLVAASLAAYTSGFIHIGLLFASLLALAPVLGGMTRRSAVGLAAAGLAGAALAVVTYHPETVSNLALSVVPSAVEASPAEDLPAGQSPLGRLSMFLGAPLFLAGAVGLGLLLVRPRGASPRLLVAGWALSGAVAYALRFAFPELLLHQKEMYWIAALFSVGAGTLAARGPRPWGWLVLAAIAALTLARLYEMIPLYYETYRFL